MYVLVVLACLPAPSLTLPEPWAVMYPEWLVREIQCRAAPEPEEEAS